MQKQGNLSKTFHSLLKSWYQRKNQWILSNNLQGKQEILPHSLMLISICLHLSILYTFNKGYKENLEKIHYLSNKQQVNRISNNIHQINKNSKVIQNKILTNNKKQMQQKHRN
jgi:hypothetical protein